MGPGLASDDRSERLPRWGEASGQPMSQPGPGRRLNLSAAIEASPARPNPTATSTASTSADTAGAILSRLDDLSRLLARREAERGSTDHGRLARIEVSLEALARRQNAEIPALREASGARVLAVEAICLRALSDTEARLTEAMSMQGQVVEALLAEKERADAALTLLQGGLAAVVTEAEACEGAVAARLAGVGAAIEVEVEARMALAEARIESRLAETFSSGGLAAALTDCSARLSEVLDHVEAEATEQLPGGASIRSALRRLSDQIAAVDARLGATAALGDEAARDRIEGWLRVPAVEAATRDVRAA